MPASFGPEQREGGRPRVLAANHDPGGANALAPVLRRLHDEGLVEVVALAYGYGAEAFARHGLATLPPQSFGVATDGPEAAARLLDRARPDLVLTGTSEVPSLEKPLWAAARRARIPALAILDYWSNYVERFAGPGGSLAPEHLPDAIAIMDEIARDEMTAVGFPAGRLHVTGSPHLEEVASLPAGAAERAARLRADLGVAAGAHLVVFASEANARLCGVDASSPRFMGFTERTALEELLGALEALAPRRPLAPHVVVKLHPKESPAEYAWLESRGCPFPLRCVGDVDPRTLILAADLVAGMTSMFLLEAVLLGKPVLSLQPGRLRDDVLISNRAGASVPVYEPGGAAAALEGLLFDAALRARLRVAARRLLPPKGATRAVAALVHRFLAVHAAGGAA